MSGINFTPSDLEIIELSEKFCNRILDNLKKGLSKPGLEDKVTQVFNLINDAYMISNQLDVSDDDAGFVTAGLTAEKLEEIAAVAAAFDESGDELLQKQANVLDEILLTLSAPKDYAFNFKKAEDDRLDILKKKYKEPKDEQDQVNKVSESLDAIKKSPVYKEYRPMEAPLSSRTCVDHPGAQLARVGENTWQCSLDHKVYNYDVGFTTLKGDKVPGGTVTEQTPKYHDEGHQMFDSRPQRLGTEYM
jgi:hypothetical protein